MLSEEMVSQLFNKQKTNYKYCSPEYLLRSFTMWCTSEFHTKVIAFSNICK